jgi:hypothetical protein
MSTRTTETKGASALAFLTDTTGNEAVVSTDLCQSDMTTDKKSKVPAEADNKPESIELERAKLNSRLTLSSYSGAALVADAYRTFDKVDLRELQHQLHERCAKIKNGDLVSVGTMLISQASSLNVIFTRLALDASANMHISVETTERYLRLALKAQGQCRATLETLVAIKSPPVVFAKQANIAHGPQQVNNGEAVPITRAEKIENKPNELLEHDHGERLDTRTASKAGRSDQAMATVATIHRPANRKRQSGSQS